MIRLIPHLAPPRPISPFPYPLNFGYPRFLNSSSIVCATHIPWLCVLSCRVVYPPGKLSLSQQLLARWGRDFMPIFPLYTIILPVLSLPGSCARCLNCYEFHAPLTALMFPENNLLVVVHGRVRHAHWRSSAVTGTGPTNRFLARSTACCTR